MRHAMFPRLGLLKRSFGLGVPDHANFIGWLLNVGGYSFRCYHLFDGGDRNYGGPAGWTWKSKPNELLLHRWGRVFPR